MPRHLSRSLLCGLAIVLTAHGVHAQSRSGASPRPKTPQRAALPSGPRSILKRHSKGVQALAFSPDGNFLVSGGEDGTVRRWDVASGRELAKYPTGGENSIIVSVRVSPDGKVVAACGNECGIRLWDVATSAPRSLFDSGDVAAIAFAPDGATIASGDLRSVRLWDVATGEEKMRIDRKSAVRAVDFSPDGKLVAWGAFYSKLPNDLGVWDVGSGKEAARPKEADFMPYDVAFSPDGKLLAACGQRDTGTKVEGVGVNASVAVIRLWDPATGEVRAEYDAGKTREADRLLFSLSFSPDGRLLALGTSEEAVEIWEAAPLRKRGVLKGHTDYVEAVAFSPDGKTLASGGRDGAIRLWDVPSAPTGRQPGPAAARPGEIRRFAGHEGKVAGVAISPDGRLALSGGDDADLRVWEVATGKALHRLKGHSGAINGVAFVRDGRRALTCGADRTVRVWDVVAGRELHRLEGHASPVACVAVAPDGRHAVSGGAKELILWDLQSGKVVAKFEGVAENVRSVAITPDSGWALTGGDMKALRVWDLKGGRSLRSLEGHDEAIASVAVAPDAQMAATGSDDDSASFWNLQTGEEGARIAEEHEEGVTAVALARGGRLLTGSGDGKLRVWDGPAERLLLKLEGHAGAITGVAFGPDGRTALSAGADGTVRLWGLTATPPGRGTAPARRR